MAARDPLPLSVALSELIAIRGFARVRSDSELEAAWKQVAGPDLAAQTRPVRVSRGTLTVSVENAPLLSELGLVPGAGTFTTHQATLSPFEDSNAEVQIERNLISTESLTRWDLSGRMSVQPEMETCFVRSEESTDE